jgi:Mn-dependent DtxR family transcriptional regulator
MPSVVAVPITDLALERGEIGQEEDENLVMKIVAASPRASLRMIAEQAKFSKSKIERIFRRLVDDKMLSKHRSKYRLTEKGKKELGIRDEDD